jgi:hypothetical protein
LSNGIPTLEERCVSALRVVHDRWSRHVTATRLESGEEQGDFIFCNRCPGYGLRTTPFQRTYLSCFVKLQYGLDSEYRYVYLVWGKVDWVWQGTSYELSESWDRRWEEDCGFGGLCGRVVLLYPCQCYFFASWARFPQGGGNEAKPGARILPTHRPKSSPETLFAQTQR